MLQGDDEHASITGELVWPRFRYRDTAWAILLNFMIECITKTKKSFFDQKKLSKHAPLWTRRSNHSFAVGIPARVLEIVAVNSAKTKRHIND